METNVVKRPHAVETCVIGGQTLTLETGKLATLAQGACTLRLGDTMVLVTAGVSPDAKDIDFMPLTVEYMEKYYAVGKIKGGRYQKREGRPSESAVLNSRMIDRPLRPMFPSGLRNEVQVLISVLSCDMEQHPANISITAASCALMLSGVPFEGPVAGVRIGRIDGQLIVNPTYQQMEEGDLDLVVAGTMDSITMVEAGANEVPADVLLEAFQVAHEAIKEQCAMQLRLLEVIQPKAMVVELKTMPEALATAVRGAVSADEMDALYGKNKEEFHVALHAIEERVLAQFASELEADGSAWTKGYIKDAIKATLKDHLRKRVLEDNKRLDLRGPRDIRAVSCGVGIIPRTHGSGLFQRGDTQVLSLTTLGAPGDAQLVEDMDHDYTKRYLHHYNFPPFSTGEVRPMRGTGRREIGHGNLAERGLVPVLPEKTEFPYTIRVVSETLACNGSSSMGSVCGSTLSLMDAGVPIKRPVVGIAMGLIMDDETGKYVVLSDIVAQEDFLGDMDFKYVATGAGVTALQMDMKIKGLPVDLFRNAVAQAEEGRAYILQQMLAAIGRPRTELSPFAPSMLTLQINPDQIRLVIGPGGKVINDIVEQTGAKIDIDDDGLIVVTAETQEAGEKAKKMIERITYVPKAGDEFEGKVTKIMDFGAFVEIVPGKEGLVHISQLAPFRVNNVADMVKEGDILKVRLEEVDKQGRYNLTHKPFYEEKKSA